MKNIKWILLLLLQPCLTACYEESALTPNEEEPAIFDKHQIDENGKYYELINGIDEKYGVKLVYDNFSVLDMNYIKGGAKNEDYRGRYLTDAQLNYQLNYLCDNIFNDDMIPYELTQRLFKPYIYLCYDMTWQPGKDKKPAEFLNTGKDFWAISMQNKIYPYMKEITTPFFPDTPTRYKDTRTLYYKNIFADMIDKKIIEVPLFLRPITEGGEIDYVTPLAMPNTGTLKDPNFFLNRGLPGSLTLAYKQSMTDLGINTAKLSTPESDFMTYLFIAIRFTPEEMESGEGWLTMWGMPENKLKFCEFPVFMDKYKRIINYMKEEYNWDLLNLAKMPTEIPPVPCEKYPDESELGELIPEE